METRGGGFIDVVVLEMRWILRFGSFGDVKALKIWQLWKRGDEMWWLYRCGSLGDAVDFEIW